MHASLGCKGLTQRGKGAMGSMPAAVTSWLEREAMQAVWRDARCHGERWFNR